jgi:hypothetical protein
VDHTATAPNLKAFDTANIMNALTSLSAGKLLREPRLDVNRPEERVFIVSWVDSYGMGYALTDGSVGVHFNDSTTLVLSPDKRYVLPAYI